MNMFKIDRPTSEEDIKYILNSYNVKILRYRELKTVDIDIFHAYDCVFVLYEQEINKGHWTVIYLMGDVINFFDSYGFKYPNDEFDYISEYFKKITKINRMDLYTLLFRFGEVEHNDIQYQTFHPRIKTCGLWCCARFILRDLTPKNFRNYFLKDIDDPDEFVTSFINTYTSMHYLP